MSSRVLTPSFADLIVPKWDDDLQRKIQEQNFRTITAEDRKEIGKRRFEKKLGLILVSAAELEQAIARRKVDFLDQLTEDVKDGLYELAFGASNQSHNTQNGARDQQITPLAYKLKKDITVSRFYDYLFENGVTEEDFDSIYLFKRLLPDRQTRKLGRAEFFSFFERDIELLGMEQNASVTQDYDQTERTSAQEDCGIQKAGRTSTDGFYDNFSVDSDYQEMRYRICGQGNQRSKDNSSKRQYSRDNRVHFADEVQQELRSYQKHNPSYQGPTKSLNQVSKENLGRPVPISQSRQGNGLLENINLNVVSVGKHPGFKQAQESHSDSNHKAQPVASNPRAHLYQKQSLRPDYREESSRVESTSYHGWHEQDNTQTYQSDDDHEIDDLSLKKLGTGSVSKRYAVAMLERRDLVSELNNVKGQIRAETRSSSMTKATQLGSRNGSIPVLRIPSHASNSRQTDKIKYDDDQIASSRPISPRLTAGDAENAKVPRKGDQNTPSFKAKERNHHTRMVTEGHKEVKLSMGNNSFSNLPVYASNASTSKSPSPAKKVFMAHQNTSVRSQVEDRAANHHTSGRISEFDTIRLHSESVTTFLQTAKDRSRSASQPKKQSDYKSKSSDPVLELLKALLTSETRLELIKSNLSQSKDFNVSNLFDHIDQHGNGFLTKQDLLEFFGEDLGLDIESNPTQVDGLLCSLGDRRLRINFCGFSKLFYPLSKLQFEAMRKKMYSYSTVERIQLTPQTTQNLVEFFRELLKAHGDRAKLGRQLSNGCLVRFLQGVLGVHGRNFVLLEDLEFSAELEVFNDEVKEKVFEMLDRGYCGKVTEQDLLGFIKEHEPTQ